jgi:hypothetical protein
VPPAARPAGTYQLRPGVAVFGWVPYWVPAAYLQPVDFGLLSHVAYSGYHATEAGALQAPPTGDAGPLAALVHQANPRCRVLLSVGYQEPASGGALFGAAGGLARQALAQAVARQVAALGADGIHLDLAFGARPGPAASAAPRPGTKSELASTRRRLNKTLGDLNYRNRLFNQMGEGLQYTRADFTKRQQKGKPVTDNELSQYARAQQQHHADSVQFIKDRTRYRAERDALKKDLVLPAADPIATTDGRPAAVRELVAALRQALPQATLTLGLPALDSSRVYAGLLAAGPLADAYVLQALDYQASPAAQPGPLAPWPAVTASVDYYRQRGVAAGQLLLGLASLSKVWTLYSPAGEMPAEGAPVHYWYGTSRSLAGWPARSARPDAASGSLRLTLPPLPDSVRGPLLNAPYQAWADDTTTLGARYEWVRQQGLGGVGIWALGFDAPDAPLWQSVRAHLAVAAGAAVAASVAPDTTARPAAVAGPAPDTTVAATAPSGDNSALDAMTNAMQEVQHSKLLTVVLLGLAVLLAGAWVGLVVGAARTAPLWVPFGRRLAWLLAVLLAGAALLGCYVSSLGVFSTGALWAAWLSALALLGLGWVVYRRARPAYPLP